MKKRYLMGLLLCTAVLSGCSVNKDWVATGGSRADATIKLSYQYGFGQDVIVSEQQAVELAKKRCNVWGYTGAEAFGGVTRVCNQMGSMGCNDGIVTKEYQCIGQGNETSSKPVQQPVSYQQVPAQQYQPVPVAQPQVIQQPIVQPVTQTAVEDTMPSYQQTYQQPQANTSGKDVRSCLALVDNALIAKCVRNAK
jgi:hypothetical protein